MSNHPRLPLSSGRGNSNRVFSSVSNGDESETLTEKVTTKQETKVEVKDKVEHDNGKHKHHGRHHDSGFSCAWIIWIIVIFIFVLFIVLGCFWVFRPGFVTKKGCDSDTSNDDGHDGCDFDIWKAFLWAFVITFFLVLIFGAAWWVCRR